MANWTPAYDGVYRFQDSCNVYAVPNGDAGTLFVNVGTGSWLDAAARFPQPWVLVCTHYFRDHAAGAPEAARRGMRVYVPWGDRAVFADPVYHVQHRETYLIYDNVWDTFTPITPTVPVEGLRDYDRVRLAGLDVEVVPLPGVTPSHSGYEVMLPERGKRALFCGEAIAASGKLWRVAPLQYNYNDMGGAVNAYFSARELKRRDVELLMPSMGAPFVTRGEASAALDALCVNLERLCQGRPDEQEWIARADREALQRVSDHVWLGTQSQAASWFVLSDSGKALALDYGYHAPGGLERVGPTSMGIHQQWPAIATPSRRRALLHSLDALERQFGIDHIDVVLVSHYHDDHVCAIPTLQRLHGTECWAAETFSELLEHPEAHRFPCNWPEATRVDRRLPLDEPVQWEEYSFVLSPMSGHTRFSTLIAFEADGLRFAHTGDQYFFQERGDGVGASGWADAAIRQNHVFRNGAFATSYEESARKLLEWRPDVVLSGHQAPMWTDDEFFRIVEAWGREFTERHAAVMGLAGDEVHFGLDSWGGWIWPYRVLLSTVGSATVQATLRNPLPREAELRARLTGPPGWSATEHRFVAQPHAETTIELSIDVPTTCRRQPIAVELWADGMPFGQVCEALVTVGDEF
jgi:glyoxylase-like metal-dependent hydrolase (beta-lactamase superfamily II)